MYATDVRQTSDVRQTDVRQKHRLMLPPIRGGGIINKLVRLIALQYAARKCKQNKRYRTSARLTTKTRDRFFKVCKHGTDGQTDGQTDRQTECDAICGPLLGRRAA